LSECSTQNGFIVLILITCFKSIMLGLIIVCLWLIMLFIENFVICDVLVSFYFIFYVVCYAYESGLVSVFSVSVFTFCFLSL